MASASTPAAAPSAASSPDQHHHQPAVPRRRRYGGGFAHGVDHRQRRHLPSASSTTAATQRRTLVSTVPGSGTGNSQNTPTSPRAPAVIWSSSGPTAATATVMASMAALHNANRQLRQHLLVNHHHPPGYAGDGIRFPPAWHADGGWRLRRRLAVRRSGTATPPGPWSASASTPAARLGGGS